MKRPPKTDDIALSRGSYMIRVKGIGVTPELFLLPVAGTASHDDRTGATNPTFQTKLLNRTVTHEHIR